MSDEGQDERHEQIVDLVGRLEQPPANPIVEVVGVLRDALRQRYPDVTVGSGFGCGVGDLDLRIGGYHVWIEVRPSALQKAKDLQ